ncbi:hypothetical protein M0805_002721 [Coniferiporia weirii]|nr:hypothetical protein M0805_002721 [Coniferiporia weirii]
MSRSDHLLLIKQECFKQLRGKGVPEIDPASLKDDNQGAVNPHIGNGAFAGVFRVRAALADEDIQGRGALDSQARVLLRLKEDLGVELAAVKVPHTRVMEDYLYSTEEGDYQRKAEKILKISDVAKAIDFLHGVGVVHRDIKGANIIIEPHGERFRGVLGDFGAAKEFLQGTSIVESSTRKFSERWSPPEYLSTHRGYRNDDGKGDIWALGCTLLEVLQEARPWSPLDHQEYRTKLRAHECPPLGRNITAEHRVVMEKCWKVKDERPSASELHLELAAIAQSCAP